ncbi:MAG: SAM-dependent methyltransferase [Gammaproteobacteria bacterium]|nr:SAM-dependent methyltransferase [Gammaproteobacteria bacterium]
MLTFYKPKKPHPPILSIALLSSLGLAYEVLLMRLFSIVQWHHFAYMIVSIALLGYGASGTFLTIIQNWSKDHFHALFIGNIFLFGISSWCCFTLGQLIPFNALELFWDNSQWIWLLFLYLLFIIPFFCIANCVALSFSFSKQRINLTYAADLVGASTGAIGIVFLLNWIFPEQALNAIVSLAMLAALLAVLELGMNKRWIGLLIIVAILPWSLPDKLTELHASEYKPLNQTLNIIGTNVLQKHSSPLGLLTVVESTQIPFRHAPGLSMTATQLPPEQIAVFTDGNGMTVINRYNGDIANLDFLDQTSSALPYHLLQKPDVLILGVGGGSDILQAISQNAGNIDAVELNRQMVGLLQNDYAQYSGNIVDYANVNIHIAEARGFITTRDKKYDLIQVSLMDSFGSASAGLTSLSEDYLYTTDALKIYLEHLNPDGILAFTRWIRMPPRDTLKLVATAKTALQQLGIRQPDKHLALIRSWSTATLLVKIDQFTREKIDKIRQFSSERSFDIAYYPGISAKEVNQFNILTEPFFYSGTKAILSEQYESYLQQYKYDLNPSSDNRPFFFHFLKLSTLQEILRLPANQGLPLIEWGTVILLITLTQASLASILLIILPLWWYQHRKPENGRSGTRTFVFSYFFLIGLAFMFIEMAFVQKFILFLSHPLYAFAIVICAFLLFAGIGSTVSKKLPKTHAIKFTISGILICTGLYMLLLQSVFDVLISAPDAIKIITTFILIAPLAFFMGMPFPLALAHISEHAPHYIPWAWGVNGCASVISAILATLLAIQYGFTVVILLAVALYISAFFLFFQQGKLTSS